VRGPDAYTKHTPETEIMKLRVPQLTLLVICACLGLLGAARANAGGVSNATVTAVMPFSPPNLFFVVVDVSPTGVPACGTLTSSSKRFVVDLTTDGGKAMAATLLTAYSLNSQIDIVGLGSCAVWGDTETINYIVAH
jgi:hypothetical protein